MLKLAAFIALISLPLAARAELAEVTGFVRLAGLADAVVAGTITKVEDSIFELRVDDAIAGDLKTGAILKVRQFQDWSCAQRWSKYDADQKVLLFLNHIAADELWVIGGGADEGESPIVRDEVYANFPAPGNYVTHGKKQYSFKPLKYAELRQAIVDFRATWRVVSEGDQQFGSLITRIEKIEIPLSTRPQFRSRSPATTPPREWHEFLIREIERERTLIDSATDRSDPAQQKTGQRKSPAGS